MREDGEEMTAGDGGAVRAMRRDLFGTERLDLAASRWEERLIARKHGAEFQQACGGGGCCCCCVSDVMTEPKAFKCQSAVKYPPPLPFKKGMKMFFFLLFIFKIEFFGESNDQLSSQCNSGHIGFYHKCLSIALNEI